MQGPFHVEEVQAPHSQISLGQEFLNKIAGRAFAGKKVPAGGKLGIAEAVPKKPEPVITPEMGAEQAKIAGRTFAEKRSPVEKVADAVQAATPEEEKPDTGLKDKQKFLMLGGKQPETE
jgi:hypothetical protein